MLYVGKRYTVRLAGSVLKGAYCENCDCEYVYRLERTAEGQGSSPYYLDNSGAQRRAQEAAARALVVMLRGTDAVPCPDCGWYQPNMFSHLGGRYGWLMAAWITGALAMLICFAIGLEPFLYATAVNAVFFFLWLFLRRAFKPNFRAHERAGERIRGKPDAILRSILEPKLKELEESDQESLRRAFDEIDAAKAKLAGKFKPGTMDPKAQEAAEADRKRGLRLQLGMLAFVEVAAFVAIGPISAWKAEADAYAKVTPTNQYAMERYLREFPNGKHAADVRDIRDDFHWDTAQSSASSTHTSQPVRQYLADGQNTRHRDEAKQKLKAMCAEALKHAEDLQQSKDIDPHFAEWIVAALKSQQDSDHPTITVSFEPLYTLEVSAAVSDEEEKSKVGLLLKDPQLKADLDRNQSADRIIDSGSAFSEVSTQRRNGILVQRLQEVVDKALDEQVVTVIEVPKCEQSKLTSTTVPPMIRVSYQVTPAGKLAPLHSSGLGSNLCGFLRVHRLDWSISFEMKNLDRATPIQFCIFTLDNGPANRMGARNEGVSYGGVLDTACSKACSVLTSKIGLK